MTATLSSDHRVVDGVGAARFLATLKGLVEAPCGLGHGRRVTLLAGAAEVDITPPFPVDLLGYVRRPLAARSAYEPLMATACVFRDEDRRDDRRDHRGRRRRADHADGRPHPGARRRASAATRPRCCSTPATRTRRRGPARPQAGRRDRRLDRDRAALLGDVPDQYASAACGRSAWLRRRGSAAASARRRASRSTAGSGRRTGGPSWAGTRTAFVDDSVVAIRIDGVDGARRVADRHDRRVRLPPGRHGAGRLGRRVRLRGAVADPGRTAPARRRGGVPAGRRRQRAAAGVVLRRRRAPRGRFGRRLGLEAAHAVVDADPRAITMERSDWGSVTPISLYRRGWPTTSRPSPRDGAAERDRCRCWTAGVGDLAARARGARGGMSRRGAAGETRVTINPIRYHIEWIELMLAQEARRLPRHRARRDLGRAPGRLRGRGRPGRDLRGDRRRGPGGLACPGDDLRGLLQRGAGLHRDPEEYPHGGYEPASRSAATLTRAVLAGRRGHHPRTSRSSCSASCSRRVARDRASRAPAGPRRGHRPRGRRPVAAAERLGGGPCALPLRFWRQQAHLTTPAAEAAIARKAVEGGTAPMARILERFGLTGRGAGGAPRGADAAVVEAAARRAAPGAAGDARRGGAHRARRRTRPRAASRWPRRARPTPTGRAGPADAALLPPARARPRDRRCGSSNRCCGAGERSRCRARSRSTASCFPRSSIRRRWTWSTSAHRAETALGLPVGAHPGRR